MRFKSQIVFLLMFVLGCSQHKLDFDLQKQALISCDRRVIIRSVRIMEADNYGVVYQIRLKEGSKGSNVLYLTSDNEGYDTGSGSNSYLKLQPNKEYVITSVQGDSGLEMRVFTDADGNIESVQNEFTCK